MHPIAEKYLRKSALPMIFCPGCGHGTVLNAFLRVVDDLGIIDDLSLVGGIGCSSWAPVFVNTDVLHTLHGRALAVATGLKLAQPKRHVVVFSGDGDCIGIGGNHFMHAARRNIDLTVILLDNFRGRPTRLRKIRSIDPVAEGIHGSRRRAMTAKPVRWVRCHGFSWRMPTVTKISNPWLTARYKNWVSRPNICFQPLAGRPPGALKPLLSARPYKAGLWNWLKTSNPVTPKPIRPGICPAALWAMV